MITDFLTQNEREKGARLLLLHALFNGLGYGFLAETIIYLLALQFNPTNTQLGFISSAIHIAGLVLLFIPRLTNGMNLRKLFFSAWMFRGAVSTFYVLLIFTRGQTAVVLILGIYSLFCISRIVGASMAEPVQQMVASTETRGRFIAQMFISNQSARLVSQLISYIMTSIAIMSELNSLLVLIGLGVITNTISALFLREIPYREKSRYQKGSNLYRVLLRTVKNREQRLVIFIRCFSLSAAVLIGFTTPFLRVVAGYAQNMVFLYSLVGTVGMIVSGLFLRPIVDNVGSKPLLMASFTGQAAIFIIWASLKDAPLGLFLGLGFFTTFLQASVFQLVARLVYNVIPEEDKISFMSLLNFITAVFSFLAGIAGGLLIDLAAVISLPFGSDYSLTFTAGSIYCAIAFLLVVALRDQGSLGMRQAANIIFSPRNFKTFLDIYTFNLTANPIKRQNILTALNYSPTPQAEQELRQILNNPIAPEKDQILISLYTTPRPRLLGLIIREAENPESAQRSSAIFALGAYPVEKSRNALFRLYQSEDPRISCAAAKSLARIGNPANPAELETRLSAVDLPTRAMQDLMVALSVAGEQERYLRSLFQLCPAFRGEYHQQSILALAAALEAYTPRLDLIYSRENGRSGGGLWLIIEEARPFQPFFDAFRTIPELYREAKYNELREWCNRIVIDYGLDGHPLTHSMRADSDSPTASVTLGHLYYTFQLMNLLRQPKA
jgi:predicted MFS family arabinose efflux permease